MVLDKDNDVRKATSPWTFVRMLVNSTSLPSSFNFLHNVDMYQEPSLRLRNEWKPIRERETK